MLTLRHISLSIAACLLMAVVVSGCHTPLLQAHQKTTYRKATVKPKFINGMYMDRHVKTNVSSNLVDVEHGSVSAPATNLPEPEPEEIKEAPADTIAATEPPPPPPVATKKSRKKKKKKEKELAAISPVFIDFNKTKTDSSNTTAPTAPAQETATTDVKPSYTPRTAFDSIPFTAEEKDTLSARFGRLMNVDPKTISNFPLYRFIDRWYDVPYRIGGSDTNGIDCSGFSQKLYETLYATTLLRTAHEQHKKAKRIKKAKNAVEGDLVFFHERFRVSHVGVYLGNDYFVHSSTSQGVIISSLSEKYWHRRLAGFGRMLNTDAPVEGR